MENENISGRLIIPLLLLTIAVAALSIYLTKDVFHNIFSASYFSLAALLGANDFGFDVDITPRIPPFTGNFYALMFAAVIDGIVRSVIVGFVLAALINFVMNIDVMSTLSLAKAKVTRKHTIVCGYSMLAERLCRDLQGKKKPFLVVEKNLETADMLRDFGYTVVVGDFTSKEALEKASLATAKAIVFTTESDFINLLGIVTARHLNATVEIISRVREEASMTKMRRAGANFCLVPEQVVGAELGNRLIAGA